MSESKSSLTFLHKVLEESIKDGKKATHEEQVIHGSKGLTIKFYHKKDNKVEKISIRSEGDEYKMTHQDGDKKEEKTLSKKEMIDVVSKNKDLAFAKEYVSKHMKGGYRHMSRKSSRKASKKASKKASRKHSKKSSRKH